MNYTDEQKKDITNRMEKGQEYLASIGLQVAVQIIPYLQDNKYTNPDGSPKEVVETPEVEVITENDTQ